MRRLSEDRAGGLIAAVFFIGLLVLYLANLSFWPGVLFVIGASVVPLLFSKDTDLFGALMGPLWMIGLGALFETDTLWPGILLLIGATGLLQAIFPSSEKSVDDESLASTPAADQEEAGDVVEAPSVVNDAESKRSNRLDRASMYRAGIDDLIHSHSGAKRVSLENAAAEMDKGLEAIGNLERRLGGLKTNPLFIEDTEAVPRAVERTEKLLEEEQDPLIRAELERTLKSQQAQLQNIRHLENVMRRADIQIDNLLASMGTVYTQMQLIDAKSLDSSRARRLLSDVSEQVESTQDIIYAMDELYQMDQMDQGSRGSMS